MNDKRLEHVKHFYKLLDVLEGKVGGKRILAECHGRMDWPKRGVYFFFEQGEPRTTSGEGSRVVRVGTHALKSGSKATLWNRLRQHRGKLGGRNPGSGNHRGSVFREHVGTALIEKDNWSGEIAGNWGGSNAPRQIKDAEVPLEREISKYIGSMPFIWLEIDDEPSPDSIRGVIERNTISLLSNFCEQSDPIDPASDNWLGKFAKSDDIKQSGLWNVNHVRECYEPDFLILLDELVAQVSQGK